MEATELEEVLKSIQSLDARISVLERAAKIVPIVNVSPAARQQITPQNRIVMPPPLPVPHSIPEARLAVAESVIHRSTTPQDVHGDLEATIGRHWAGWIGAIVFVLGMLFFLKYAWEQGWINPTPTARIVAAIAVGVAMSAAGEWMHRRKIKTLAATLHGAGLAIVMASFFASYALFDPGQRVLSMGGALVGVMATAGIGIALSLRIDSISLASIALIGAYLAPFGSTPAKIARRSCLHIWVCSAAWGCLCRISSRDGSRFAPWRGSARSLPLRSGGTNWASTPNINNWRRCGWEFFTSPFCCK